MATTTESPILDLSIKPKDHKSGLHYFPPTLHPETSPYEFEAFRNCDLTSYYPINSHMTHQSYSLFPPTAPLSPLKEPEKPLTLVNHESPMQQMQNMRIPSIPKNDIANISLHGVKKPPRPFKVYPKVPLLYPNSALSIVPDQSLGEAYESFRIRMLESVQKANKGTNVRMRRDLIRCSASSTIDDKDEAYREKRKKNNEAAKRSRDARKQKEDEIAIRAAYLEQENSWLKSLLWSLKEENEKLRKFRGFQN